MKKKVAPQVKKTPGSPNRLAQPRLLKVVINSGVGKLRKDKAKLEAVARDLAIISGQKPAFASARQSIAAFSLRQGELIGYKVTLRGPRMVSFVERLVKLALPRTRDFRGLAEKGFDQRGNYTLGIKEHTVFPEIKPDEVIQTFGFEVTIVTTAKDPLQGKAFLQSLGFPFAKD